MKQSGNQAGAACGAARRVQDECHTELAVRPLRIALVDDDPEICDCFSEILTRLGHRILAAAPSGDRLIEQCRDDRPELIITDVTMRGLNGIDASRIISPDQRLPVLVITNLDAAEVSESAADERVAGVLVKPVSTDVIQSAIAEAVGSDE